MECTLERITIHYEIMGAGRPILMLHGWTLDHRHMVSNMEPLFDQRSGWKRIYLDLPGMGKTPSADWITSQDHMLEVLLEFIDQVIPGQRFTVAGASLGGYLARGIVQRRSSLMDGLLLIVPVIQAENEKRKLPQHITLVEDPTVLSEMDPEQAKEFQELAVVQSRGFLDSLKESIFPAVEIADHQFLDKVRERYAFSFDVDKLQEPFGKPTLIIAGRQDSVCGYCDAWDILENYPRGTFAVLDRAGHGLEFEQQSVFRVLVSEWLDRVEETQSHE